MDMFPKQDMTIAAMQSLLNRRDAMGRLEKKNQVSTITEVMMWTRR